MRLRFLIPALAMLGGCAVQYVDADGNRRFVGLMNLTLPPVNQSGKGADFTRMRTVGVAFSHTDIGGALEIGYSDNTVLAIQNNSCIVLPKGAQYAAQSPDRTP
jgi:hypothetical protein